jgi:hypothetical protein
MPSNPPTVVAVIASAALALAGCHSSTATTPTGASATSPAGNATHLTAYAANTDGPTSTVILAGAVGDFGTATSVHPDGTVDPEHSSQLKLTLTGGTFRIGISDLHSKLVTAFGRFPTNAATCSGTVTVSATAPIVTDSGTGSYAHISGSFTLTLTVDEIDKKPTCDGSGVFLAQTILITGFGTVSVS